MSHVRILVCVVTYNSSEVIDACLADLSWLGEAQGLEGHVVVIDNASQDDTALRAERAKERLNANWLTVVRSRTNRGWGAGNNKAISARPWEPDYVLLCNPDATIDEDNFRALLRALRAREPRAALAVPYLEGPTGTTLGANPRWGLSKYFFGAYTGGKGRYRRFQKKYRNRRGTFEIRDGSASGALVLISYSALRRAGPFDERIFLFNDDVDMTRRILRLGFALVGTADSLGHHVGGRGSRLGEEAKHGVSTASLAFESDLVFVEKWYGKRWARLVAGYRWHVFFRVNGVLRKALGKNVSDYRPLRASAGVYLGKIQG